MIESSRHDAGSENRRIADTEFNEGITERYHTARGRMSACPHCGTSYGLYDLNSAEEIDGALAHLTCYTREVEFWKSTNPYWEALFVRCDCCRGPRDLANFLPVTIEEARTWIEDHPDLVL